MNAYEQALANPNSALSKFIVEREDVVNPSRELVEKALEVYGLLGGSEFFGSKRQAVVILLRRALEILEKEA
jgi:hypothetical protein